MILKLQGIFICHKYGKSVKVAVKSAGIAFLWLTGQAVIPAEYPPRKCAGVTGLSIFLAVGWKKSFIYKM